MRWRVGTPIPKGEMWSQHSAANDSGAARQMDWHDGRQSRRETVLRHSAEGEAHGPAAERMRWRLGTQSRRETEFRHSAASEAVRERALLTSPDEPFRKEG
jgi:hypothetical protein